ncbi:MAG: SAM-dependent methyltransferase, partial [Bryobacteraceae bacterium]
MADSIGSTAVVVAQMRAVESSRPDRVIEDPLAAELVAAAGIPGVDSVGLSTIQSVPMLSRIYAAVVHRTRFLDDHLLDAIGSGCGQVVVLAAGLDSRAFRLGCAATFFEIDLENVLEFKEPVVATKELGATRRTVIAEDLTDKSWTDKLITAGFDPSVQTAWIAEGILMYLTDTQNDALMAAIAGLSVAGSYLMFVTNGPGWLADGHSRQLKQAVDSAGFGFQSHLDEPENWLTRFGWNVHEVVTLEQVGHRLGRID